MGKEHFSTSTLLNCPFTAAAVLWLQHHCALLYFAERVCITHISRIAIHICCIWVILIFCKIKRQQEVLTSFPRGSHLLGLLGEKSEDIPALGFCGLKPPIFMIIFLKEGGLLFLCSSWHLLQKRWWISDSHRCLGNVQKMALNKKRFSD